jgi:predicted PurR-regulated permease PerM
VLAPFIIGFAFAYALTPVVKWLEKKGVRKWLAVLGVVMVILLIIVGLLVLILPLLYDQASLLVDMVSKVINNFDKDFNVSFGSFEIKLIDYISDFSKNLGGIVSSTAVDVINKSIGFVGQLIVGFVGFVYFLTDMDKIRKGFKDLLLSISKRSFKYVKLLDDELGNYLKGLVIFMIIQFFEYSLLFLIVGHPNWLLLGVLACLTTVIPYFGGLITNIIGIILASVVSVPLVIATIVICLIFPQLDGYVISPKVYGKTNNVNPLITIMAVSIGGTLAGMVGIIVALPCYLLIRTTYNFFKKDLKKGMDIVKETI